MATGLDPHAKGTRMSTSPERLDEYLRRLAPLMQSRKLASDLESPPMYDSLEFACVAARCGSEWILVFARANSQNMQG